MDDAVILAVTRAQRGDTRAFDFLVHRFQNAAVAYASALLHNAFCDRARRSAHSTLALSETLQADSDTEPFAIFERADTADRVRCAIESLPDPQREVTLLYYFTGRDVKEIAAFLELPQSTVKNRLHAARKRLRKELWIMAESTFDQEKPSRDDQFAGNVLARVLQEFDQQEASDPHTANRALLDKGRTALFAILETDAPLDEATARDGFMLLWRKCDWNALAGLLTRYLLSSQASTTTLRSFRC